MKRKIYEKLIDWKKSPDRMPLILQGARQIGKTYIVNVFAQNEYDNFVYINFESEEKFDSIFSNLDPNIIIDKIENYTKKSIIPNKTLLIFDEIQKSEKALTSLKYFCEKRRDIHIIATGSLLGIAVRKNEFSFPVGKTNFLYMFPMDFEEFLLAMGEDKLIDTIRECFENNVEIDNLLHEKLIDLYYTYLYIGGMPDAITTYLNTKNEILVNEKKNIILSGYVNDMTKYNTKTDVGKTILVYSSIIDCLAKENKKYMYSSIKKSARAKDYDIATEWLTLSGIAKKIYRISNIKIPLEAYKDNDYFKLYMNDVGLLTSKMKLELADIKFSSEISDFKGGLAENYVYTQIGIKNDLYYYKDNTDEVDFVMKNKDGIIPIEVKSGIHTKSTSLNNYIKRYNPKYAIKISLKNFGYENNIKSVPLYAAFLIND